LERLAVGRIPTLKHFLIAHSMKQEDLSADDNRPAESRTDANFPKLRRTILGPFALQAGLWRMAVTRRPEKLRPVGSERERRSKEKRQNSWACLHRSDFLAIRVISEPNPQSPNVTRSSMIC